MLASQTDGKVLTMPEETAAMNELEQVAMAVLVAVAVREWREATRMGTDVAVDEALQAFRSLPDAEEDEDSLWARAYWVVRAIKKFADTPDDPKRGDLITKALATMELCQNLAQASFSVDQVRVLLSAIDMAMSP